MAAGVLTGLGGCGTKIGITGMAESGAAMSAASSADSEENTITVGFAQVGEESDWRRANSVSIKETFTSKNGCRLLFDDAQNEPEKQITAIANFVQQGVDYIVLEPIVETGWDTVLSDAKAAGIPVIVADRMIEVEDESLYAAWVGSDCLLEGRKVCEWLHSYAESEDIDPSELKIVNIQGTLGSTPQIDRDLALTEAAEKYGWTLLGAERGEFTQAKGRETMAQFLIDFPELNVVYCDNDNEAYGAIEAIEEAGRTCGSNIEAGEIMILSFDATSGGLRYVLDGTISCDAECNPLHGPRIEEIIRELEAGREPERLQYVAEGLYVHDDTVETVEVDGKSYPAHVVTEELIGNRVY